MDPVANPYSPNAGAPPPALVGRDRLIADFDIALARVLARRSEKSMLPTGLRGVGKTVLLNRFVEDARKRDYVVVQVEASESGSFLATLVAEIRRAMIQLDFGQAVKNGLMRILKSFSITYDLKEQSVSLGVDPAEGSADSGSLSVDLTTILEALGRATQERQRGVMIAIDEVQYLDEAQLEALIMAVHKMTQLQLPIIVVGTGLPQLPALAGNAKSYAERLFSYPNVGPLSRDEMFEAVSLPAREQAVEFTADALDRLYEITKGYPYFVQEWSYRVWNYAPRSPITLNDVNAVEPEVLKNLDESFFRVRYDRLTGAEKRYLRAMAELGPGPHRSGDIANLLGVKSESTSPLRGGLIKKGMIYSPQHGDTAFTVPLFDEFMKRTQPLEKAPTPRRRQRAK